MPNPIFVLWTSLFVAGYGGTFGTLQSGSPDYEAGFVSGHLDPTAISAHVSGDAYVKVGRDQSGNGFDVSEVSSRYGGGPVGPRIWSSGALEHVGSTNAMRMTDAGGDMTLEANNTLGLSGDPALTFAWKMSLDPQGSAQFWCLAGLSGEYSATIGIAMARDPFSGHDIITANDYDKGNYVLWEVPLNSLDSWHSYVMTKPVGGYSSAWRLAVDGVDQGAPDDLRASIDGGAINITENLFFGSYFNIAGDPTMPYTGFYGHLAGFAVWDHQLSNTERASVQSFLDSQ